MIVLHAAIGNRQSPINHSSKMENRKSRDKGLPIGRPLSLCSFPAAPDVADQKSNCTLNRANRGETTLVTVPHGSVWPAKFPPGYEFMYPTAASELNAL